MLGVYESRSAPQLIAPASKGSNNLALLLRSTSDHALDYLPAHLRAPGVLQVFQFRASFFTPTLFNSLPTSIVLTVYLGQPHYAAPMTTAFYVATLLVMRDIYVTRAGRFLTRAVPLIAVLLFLARAAAPAVTRDSSWIRIWCSENWQNRERARIVTQLAHTPGQNMA